MLSATGLLLVINYDTTSKTDKHRLAFLANLTLRHRAHAHDVFVVT